MKYNCPELKNKNASPGIVNNVITNSDIEACFDPHLRQGKLNGSDITILHGSGNSLDLVSHNSINNDQLNGEVVWLKQH